MRGERATHTIAFLSPRPSHAGQTRCAGLRSMAVRRRLQRSSTTPVGPRVATDETLTRIAETVVKEEAQVEDAA
jgi:hypothetical protein